MDIGPIFTYDRLDESQRQTARELFAEAKRFAEYLNEALPECREKALAITYLQNTMLWADAAIAIHMRKTAGES